MFLFSSDGSQAFRRAPEGRTSAISRVQPPPRREKGGALLDVIKQTRDKEERERAREREKPTV